MTSPLRARNNMLEGQLRAGGVMRPALVQAYLENRRERQVPAAYAPFAYADADIQLPFKGRFVLSPLAEARLLDALLDGPVGRTLVIGAASVPSIAMLARFSQALTVLEPDAGYADQARELLGSPSCTVIETGYTEGYPRHAPYDAVFITGAVAHVPDVLLAQLAPGGRLVCVLRPRPNGAGRVVLMQRNEQGAIDTRLLADTSTPYLPGFEPETGFAFS